MSKAYRGGGKIENLFFNRLIFRYAAQMSRGAEQNFIVGEYLDLWKDWGLEALPLEQLRTPAVKPKAAAAPAAKPTFRPPGRPVVARAPENKPKISSLADIETWIGPNCQLCNLCQERSKVVFGVGNPKARLMFVGEGPGADEDAQGIPFVGKAGQLLTKIIEAMGLKRDDVYIANIVKCRPPGNRTPLPDEIEACSPFVRAQIDQVKPEVIVTLGLVATATLLGSTSAMANLRGRFHKGVWHPEIAVMPTYHPAYLLRNPAAKKMVWEDMKQVKTKMETK